MCGILGALGDDRWSDEECLELSRRLAHRGPDGQGTWAEGPVVLGHRRLAILDPTERGRQPMTSASDSLVGVLNGEIYNFRELRQELETEGRMFRTNSDTEVLLEAIESWGTAALGRLRGMFAIAIWDRRTRELLLARDPLGKKPLFYAQRGRTTTFASELRVLRAAHPLALNRDALPFYFRLGYVPGPSTIYEGVRSVEPGTWIRVRPEGLDSSGVHWTLPADVQIEEQVNANTLVEELEPLLRTAVARRLVSDVPVGAFLSGGIDSALVASYLAELAPGTTAITVGVDDARMDESVPAAATARSLDLRHVVSKLEIPSAVSLMEDVIELLDQPFGDSSVVPTLVLSRETRKHVTVALGGDGGDEAFGGYDRYRWFQNVTRATAHLGAGRIPLAHGLRLIGERGRRLARSVQAAGPSARYLELMNIWHYGSIERLCGDQGRVLAWAEAKWNPHLKRPVHAARHFDTRSYLPEDILVKVDRASMWASLEVRAPFLDVDLLAWTFAATHRCPTAFEGKRLLRAILARRMPDYEFNRPKRGFRLPVEAWLRGPLAERLRAYCDADYVGAQALFDSREIEACHREFLRGRSSLYSPLWCYLVFQLWLDHHAKI